MLCVSAGERAKLRSSVEVGSWTGGRRRCSHHVEPSRWVLSYKCRGNVVIIIIIITYL